MCSVLPGDRELREILWIVDEASRNSIYIEWQGQFSISVVGRGFT